MKIIFLAFVLMFFCSIVVTAQENNSGKKVALRNKIKNEFKFSDYLADSLLSIQFTFETNKSKILKNSALSTAQKSEKIEQEIALRNERMRVFRSEGDLQKMQSFYDKIKNL